MSGAEFWGLNTDTQALATFPSSVNVMHIGNTATRGLGAGGNPANGLRAAEENRKEIQDIVKGSDLVFVTAGMGGGTGSGAAPVVAEIARSNGALTIGVVTTPFGFEGRRRAKQASAAITKLRDCVDALIVVSNDRMLQVIPENTPLQKAFGLADDVLRQGVIGITDIITSTGLVNVDFADVKTILTNSGIQYL